MIPPLISYLSLSLLSAAATAGIAAFRERDLYNTLFLLTTNNFFLLVFLNAIVAVCLTVIIFLKNLLFGDILPNESELVKFKLRLTIPNFIYIVTLSGSGDFIYCIPVNVILLVIKIAHWLATDRLERLGNSLSSDTQQEDNENRKLLTSALSLTIILSLLDVGFSLFLFNLGSAHPWAYISLAELLLHTIKLYEAGATIVVSLNTPVGDPIQQNAFFAIQLIASVAHVIAAFIATIMLTVLTSGPPLFTLLDAIGAVKKVFTVAKNWKEWRVQAGRILMLPSPEDPSQLCTICQCPLNVRAFSEPTEGEAQSQSNFGKQLSCSHAFHAVCLMRWFAQRRACPTCSSEISLHLPDVPSATEESFVNRDYPPIEQTVSVVFNPQTRRIEPARVEPSVTIRHSPQQRVVVNPRVMFQHQQHGVPNGFGHAQFVHQAPQQQQQQQQAAQQDQENLHSLLRQVLSEVRDLSGRVGRVEEQLRERH
ncbi:hypothetical protein RCL1_002799 [Eukaryota sp. TZLM3-RCL]